MAEPNLLFLGDVFAWPVPLPLHNVFSAGDVCVVLGVALVLHQICGSRLATIGKGPRRPPLVPVTPDSSSSR
ncbi:MAG: DUF5317 family protein [Actinobacteria bacterium]|nr:DUF5317 family protein [Actinomycetota bacterium]